MQLVNIAQYSHKTPRATEDSLQITKYDTAVQYSVNTFAISKMCARLCSHHFQHTQHEPGIVANPGRGQLMRTGVETSLPP